MYGLVLTIRMFAEDKQEERRRFKVLATMIDHCAPDDKRKQVDERIDHFKYEARLDDVLSFGVRLASDAFALALGGVVHLLLA